MAKQKVVVIFGGNSPEHEVSRVSARNIINNLDADKYEVFPLGITRGGEWLLYSGDSGRLDNGDWEKSNVHKAIISPDAGDRCILIFKGNTVEKISIDVAFLALHGKNGEDGTVQGLLQLAGIPYTGADVLASALCMDKATAKHIFAADKIPQADWLVFNQKDIGDPCEILNKISAKFTYPVFVKPSATGSSVGVRKVNSPDDVIAAIQDGLRYDSKVLVEECIDGQEVECGIIGNDTPKASLVGEIVTSKEFYDFEAKYTEGFSHIVIPAAISGEKAEEIRFLAKKAYIAAGCSGFSRVDFFVERGTGRVLLNEINTIPGFTDKSMFPVVWQKSGMTFSEQLDCIISCAMEGCN